MTSRESRPDLIVAGAGMGGLVAAVQARSLGAAPQLREKRDRPGGSMALSSGVIWRHRLLEDFHDECPGGDRGLQRLIFERLDEDLDWLEALGAPVRERSTGNRRTCGRRFDPGALVEALVAAAGPLELETAVRVLPGVPLIVACGGFAADRGCVRRHVTPYADDLLLRAAPGSTGDGLRLGLWAGGGLTKGLDEFYGRAMPAPPARVSEDGFVGLAQLYARHATVRNSRGEPYRARTWSEIDVVQWIARQPGARASFEVADADLDVRVGERTVGEMVQAARAAGASVRRLDGAVRIEVVAGITTTLGGLAVDERARAAPGLFACGADAGGVAGGGYASGLAAALVLGRIAGRSAVAAARAGERPRAASAHPEQPPGTR